MIVPGVNEERLVQFVVDSYDTMRDNRRERELIWLECMKAYLAQWHDGKWLAKARDEGRSTRYLPMIWDAIETVHAQLAEILFPNDDWFLVRPRRMGGTDMADDNARDTTKTLLTYQHEEMEFVPEALKIVKWLEVIGNCPFAVNWRVERAVDFPVFAQAMEQWQQQAEQQYLAYQQQLDLWKIARVQAEGVGGVPPAPPAPPDLVPPAGDTEIAYEGPTLATLDPFEYVEDPYADDPRYAVRISRFWRRSSYLRRFGQPGADGYVVYENLERMKERDRRDNKHLQIEEELAKSFGMQVADRKTNELKELWGTFENNGRVFVNHVATIGNDNTVLRCEPSYLWSREIPRKLAKLITVPGQLYGVGLAEMALGTADMINVRANQQVDAGANVINPERVGVDDGTFDPDDDETGPNALHIVAKAGNYDFLRKDVQGLNWSVTELAMLKLELQQVMRAANPSVVHRDRMSATETARNAALSNASMKALVSGVVRTFLEPSLRLQLQYDQQYLNKDFMMRITQGHPGEVAWIDGSPDQIRNNWEIKVVGSQAFFDREDRLNKLLSFITVVGGNEMMAMTTDLQYLARQIYQEMGNEDADKVFPLYLAELQKAMIEQGMMGSLMGGGNGGNPNAGPGAQGGGQGGAGAAGGPAAAGNNGLPLPLAQLLAESRGAGPG